MEGERATSSHKGQKIRSFTMKFKLKVCEYAKVQSINATSKEFDVDRKCVREWLKQEDKLKEESKEYTTRRRRLSGAGRRVEFLDIEKWVLSEIVRRREKGGRVTVKMIKKLALRQHKINGNQQFKASWGWLRSFMKRNNLSFRRSTHVAQKSRSELDDKIYSYLRFINQLRKHRNYDISNIGNMDETPVWVDMPGDSTVDTKGLKTVSVSSTGHEKSRMSVLLTCMGDGTKKPPLVLLKGKRPPKEIPLGVQVLMTPQSWCDESVCHYYLKNIWRKKTDKRLLVWDSYRAYITPGVKMATRNAFNTDMAVIPGGCTSYLQPLDVSINKPFKDHFRDEYDEWLVDGPVDLTKGGNRRPPDRPTLLRWIKRAWDSVRPEIIRKAFLKCGLTVAMDGSQDDFLFNNEDDDDDDDDGDDPFEGFCQGSIDAAGQLVENLRFDVDGDMYNSSDNDEVSEYENSNNEDDDPMSPGR